MTSASERFGNSWKKNLLMGKNLQEKRAQGGAAICCERLDEGRKSLMVLRLFEGERKSSNPLWKCCIHLHPLQSKKNHFMFLDHFTD